MKISPRQVDAFCARPDAKIRVVLIYGADTGMVRERADLIAKSAVDDLSDPFRVAELAGWAQ